MPLLTPTAGESEKAFVSRFMGDKAMFAEYPTQEQRAAIAYSQYKRKAKKSEDLTFAHIFKKWSRQAWQASAEARKSAVGRNHDVAEGLLTKMKQLKANDPKGEHYAELNEHMIKQGYLPNGKDEKGNHVYVPFSGDEDTEHTPDNPVIGHKVHIEVNHKSGEVNAVSRYK
jgi:hypothetical protein